MNPERAVNARTSVRPGVGIPEVLVALVIAGIMGTALLRTFVSQVRFSEHQVKRSSARAVSRAPVNFLMSEVRMTEVVAGVAAATSSGVTLRVPGAMGVVCGTSGGGTAISLMPVDSVVWAQAAWSGHAWRDPSGSYTYTEAAINVAAGGGAACTTESITTPTGGRVVIVTPAMAGATAGSPAFLYQRIAYAFAPSAQMANRVALWRTLEASGFTEELAAPFDSSAHFRFFRLDNDASDVTVPPLTEIRGLELVLVGESEKPRFGKSAPEESRLRTAVFFTNRMN